MKTMSTNKEIKMRDYEYLPASQRKLAEQLDEEDFKREERTRELKEAKEAVYEAMNAVEGKNSAAYERLCKIEENILEVLNKYN